eukprot:XP_001694145.1 predicted protein [Chlamydomonas reinhardtii]
MGSETTRLFSVRCSFMDTYLAGCCPPPTPRAPRLPPAAPKPPPPPPQQGDAAVPLPDWSHSCQVSLRDPGSLNPNAPAPGGGSSSGTPYIRCEAAAATAAAAAVAAAGVVAAAAGGGAGGPAEQGATAAVGMVAVMLGPSLAPLHAAGLLQLSGVQVLQWIRTGSSSSSSSSTAATGSSNSTSSGPDFGITFVGVPHLLLRDSELTGMPLSGAAPLVVCVNCTFLTVERLTVEDLTGEPLVPSANGIPYVRRVTYGAVEANGLVAARLAGVSCSRVVNSYGFACVRLSYLPLDVRRSALLAAAKVTGAAAAASSSSSSSSGEAGVAAATTTADVEVGSAPTAPAPVASLDATGTAAAAEVTLADVRPPPVLHLLDSSFANTSVVWSASKDVVPAKMFVPTASCGASANNKTMLGYGAVLIDFDARYPMPTNDTTTAISTITGSSISNDTTSSSSGEPINVTMGPVVMSGNAPLAASVNGSSSNGSNSSTAGGGGDEDASAWSAVVVQGARFVGNRGGCGAGLALDLKKLPVKLSLSRVNATENDVMTGTFESGDGGAFYVLGGGRSRVTISGGSVLSRNGATHGGAVYAESSTSLVFEVSGGSRLVLNRAGFAAGAISVGGKQEVAIRITGSSAVSRNSVSGFGGAILAFAKTGSLVVSDHSSVSGNVANLYSPSDAKTNGGNGGGAWLEFQNTTLVEVSGGSAVSNNAAYNNGGGLYVWKDLGTFTLNGSIMSGNSARGGPFCEGGALFIDRSAANIILDGGAVMNDNRAGLWGNATVTIINCTITQNQALLYDGGALWFGTVDTLRLAGGTVIANNSAARCDIAETLPCKSGANRARGGAIMVQSNAGEVVLEGGVVAADNRAGVSGGLLHVGGALTSLRVDTGSVVRGNAALWAGGAVFGTMAVGAVEVAGGSSVSGNVAQEFGGFMAAAGRLATFTVSGGSSLTQNSVVNGSGAVLAVDRNISSFTITGGSDVSYNSAPYGSGAVLYVGGSVNGFSVGGGSTCARNTVGRAGGVVAAEGAVRNVLISEGSRVEDCAAAAYGGVIHAKGSLQNVTVKNSTIRNCTAGIGGGAFSTAGDVRNLSLAGGAALWDCTATDAAATRTGGAVFAGRDLEGLTLTGGSSIEGGGADQGGCVFVYGGARRIVLAGGSSIRRCTARLGGALFVGSEGLTGLSLTGGSSIGSSNAAARGGCVYVGAANGGGGAAGGASDTDSGSSSDGGSGSGSSSGGGMRRVTLTEGSEIFGCTAQEGGAVFVALGAAADWRLSGGAAIRANRALLDGGAIWAAAAGSWTLEGNSSISDNACGRDGAAMYVSDGAVSTSSSDSSDGSSSGTGASGSGSGSSSSSSGSAVQSAGAAGAGRTKSSSTASPPRPPPLLAPLPPPPVPLLLQLTLASGGRVSSNRAERFGAIFLKGTGGLQLLNVTGAASVTGGAASVVVADGAEVSGNRARFGGAVAVKGRVAAFELTGGAAATNQYAQYSGAVLHAGGGAAAVRLAGGARAAGNRAGLHGGLLWAAGVGEVVMTGGVMVERNRAVLGAGGVLAVEGTTTGGFVYSEDLVAAAAAPVAADATASASIATADAAAPATATDVTAAAASAEPAAAGTDAAVATQVRLASSSFTGNSAGTAGGVLAFGSTAVAVAGCVVANNTAAASGGFLFLGRQQAGAYGGVVALYGSSGSSSSSSSSSSGGSGSSSSSACGVPRQQLVASVARSQFVGNGAAAGGGAIAVLMMTADASGANSSSSGSSSSAVAGSSNGQQQQQLPLGGQPAERCSTGGSSSSSNSGSSSSNSSSSGLLVEDLVKQFEANGAAGVSDWLAALYTAHQHQQGTADYCWPLLLLDTAVPPPSVPDAATQRRPRPVWMEDANMTAMAAWCQGASTAAASSDSAAGGGGRVAALLQTLAQCSLPQLSSVSELSAAAAAAVEFPPTQLRLQLPCSMLQSGSSSDSSRSSSSSSSADTGSSSGGMCVVGGRAASAYGAGAAAPQQQPRPPATTTSTATATATATVVSVLPEEPFAVQVQLVDAHGSATAPVASIYKVTLSVRALPPPSAAVWSAAGSINSSSNNTPSATAAQATPGTAAWLDSICAPQLGKLQPAVADTGGAWWWCDPDFANLDVGRSQSLTAVMEAGAAEWPRVLLRGWPGDYLLVLRAAGPLQISELSVPLEVRRCAAGQTPDNRFAATSQVPAWTGCRTCERGQVGLLPDRRATASELATAAATAATAAAGGGAGAGGAVAVAVATRQQLLLPQLTGRAMAGEVVRASSTGGSSRSSLNTYPPPPALGSSSTGTGGSSSDGSGSSSSSSSSGVGGVGVNERTQALLACQVALYSSGSPPYGDASAGWASNATSSGGAGCSLGAYMQLQCGDGYTGNLCAACLPGYAVSQDLECGACPSMARTLGLSLLAFFGSVALILYTAIASLGAATASSEDASGVTKGDIMKAALGSITGAASQGISFNYGCLVAAAPTAQRAMAQLLGSLLVPCVVVAFSLALWALSGTSLQQQPSTQRPSSVHQPHQHQHHHQPRTSGPRGPPTRDSAGSHNPWSSNLASRYARDRSSAGGAGGGYERYSHLSHVSSAMRKLGSRALMLVRPRDAAPTSALALADTSLGFWQQLGLVLLSGVFVLYAGWAQAALSVFSCYRIDEGGSLVPENERANWPRGYWFLDMQQACYSGTHLALYLPIGIVSVCLFCLAPPLSSFLLMWRARHRLAEYRTQQMWGFMYKRYRQRFFFWESVLQLQTLALVAVDVFGRGMPVVSQPCCYVRLYFIPTDALPLSDGEATAVGAIMFALNITLLIAYVAYILALSWPAFKPHVDRVRGSAAHAARRVLRRRGAVSSEGPSQHAEHGARNVEGKGGAAVGEGGGHDGSYEVEEGRPAGGGGELRQPGLEGRWAEAGSCGREDAALGTGATGVRRELGGAPELPTGSSGAAKEDGKAKAC